MPNFKLFVVHHKKLNIPKNDIVIPIRSDMCDSPLSSDYSELRTHYFVWKNTPSDYVGFFHYRRYLTLDLYKSVANPCIKRPSPYIFKKFPNLSNYNLQTLSQATEKFDVLAPVAEYTGIPVIQRYSQAPNQRADDMALIVDIISQKYPQYLSPAHKYLDGSLEYYGNIFIMRWDLFDNYCSWLFDILNEFDRRSVNPPPMSCGHLAERLFGIYLTYLQDNTDIKCGEFQRVHFWGYDDQRHNFKRERIVNFFLPPSSKIRAFVKKLWFKHKTKGQ